MNLLRICRTCLYYASPADHSLCIRHDRRVAVNESCADWDACRSSDKTGGDADAAPVGAGPADVNAAGAAAKGSPEPAAAAPAEPFVGMLAVHKGMGDVRSLHDAERARAEAAEKRLAEVRWCDCGQPYKPWTGLYGTTEQTRCQACSLRKTLAEAETTWRHDLGTLRDVRARLAEVEAELDEARERHDELFVELSHAPAHGPCVIGQYCFTHGFIHGAEAEELRERIEQLAMSDDDISPVELQRLVDQVDARDSLAMLEARDKSPTDHSGCTQARRAALTEARQLVQEQLRQRAPGWIGLRRVLGTLGRLLESAEEAGG